MMTVQRKLARRRSRSDAWRMLMLAGLRVVRALPVAFSQTAAASLIKNQYPQVNFAGIQ